MKSGLSDGLCLVHHLAPGQVGISSHAYLHYTNYNHCADLFWLNIIFVQVYSFRVFSTGMTGPVSAFSLSSPPLTVPLPTCQPTYQPGSTTPASPTHPPPSPPHNSQIQPGNLTLSCSTSSWRRSVEDDSRWFADARKS